MSRQHLFCQFPRLRTDSLFRIIDPDPSQALDRYNCWAYALGKTDALWAHNAEWPQDVAHRTDATPVGDR
jgi:hypothetical protein